MNCKFIKGYIMKKLFFILAISLLVAIGVLAQTNNINQNYTAEKDSITFLSFKTDNGWGYDIYINDKKYIHQYYIPAVNGNRPFKTKEDAEKTAELVKTKIKKNILPPSVTINELDSIGVIK